MATVNTENTKNDKIHEKVIKKYSNNIKHSNGNR